MPHPHRPDDFQSAILVSISGQPRHGNLGQPRERRVSGKDGCQQLHTVIALLFTIINPPSSPQYQPVSLANVRPIRLKDSCAPDETLSHAAIHRLTPLPFFVC